MIELQCSHDACEFIGDMRVVGEDGGYVEAECPTCKNSTYERIGD